MDVKKTIKRLMGLKKKCVKRAKREVDGSPEYNFQYGRAEGLSKAIAVIKDEAKNAPLSHDFTALAKSLCKQCNNPRSKGLHTCPKRGQR